MQTDYENKNTGEFCLDKQQNSQYQILCCHARQLVKRINISILRLEKLKRAELLHHLTDRFIFISLQYLRLKGSISAALIGK